MFIFLQSILPQHLLSRLLSYVAHCRCGFLKNWAIRGFIRYFKVDMTESLITDIRQFPTFNDFFIRRLAVGSRPLPSAPRVIVCPADGVISELGQIHSKRLLQAKGRYYDLEELCGDPAIAQYFVNGEFCTIYLAPKDYHRVHMPVMGTLRKMLHLPGKLFSVNAASVAGIPRLFARNERVVCLFETPAGRMAVIFVGALLIGGVATTWHGPVMPARGRVIAEIYDDVVIALQAGQEIGYFQWGSTVMVLFEPRRVSWHSTWRSGDPIKMGQSLGIGRELP